MTAVVAISDYASLQSAVADYLIRSDLTTQIQLWVSLAEAKFNRDIRNRKMEQRTTAPTTSGSAYIALPSDFLEIRKASLLTNPVRPLTFRTPTQMDWLHRDQTPSIPNAYTIINGELKLSPVPDSVYSIELLYYQQIPALASVVQAASAVVASGGTGYAVNDILFGAFGAGAPAFFTVSSVSTGAVTAVTVRNSGAFSPTPANPISVTGGTGTGCTLTVTYSALGQNWLLTSHPDLYLYRTLMNAGGQLKDTDMLTQYAQWAAAETDSLMDEESRESWNGGPLQPTTDVRVI